MFAYAMLPIIHHPDYQATIPDGHRFPMGKFRRLMEVLRSEGIAREENSFQPELARLDWLTMAHDRDYVEKVLSNTVPDRIARDIGFPMNPSVARRAQCATGGTVLAARMALKHGLAANTAGGSHHARREQGAGFCVFNDVAVAAHVMRAEGLAERILIVDLDVHQGDGTADIFSGIQDVFTLSFHAAKNYPDEKRVSDLDIALRDGTNDADYMRRLHDVLPRLLDRGRPDLVFYNAGVDPHQDDKLGRLSLSDNGLVKRDHFVIDEVQRRSIPCACVIGGGYSKDLDAVASRHATIHRVAHKYTIAD